MKRRTVQPMSTHDTARVPGVPVIAESWAATIVSHARNAPADGLPFPRLRAGIEFAGEAAFMGRVSLQSNRIMLVPRWTSILSMRWGSAQIPRSRDTWAKDARERVMRSRGYTRSG